METAQEYWSTASALRRDASAARTLVGKARLIIIAEQFESTARDLEREQTTRMSPTDINSVCN
jgi:hypothetical protein